MHQVPNNSFFDLIRNIIESEEYRKMQTYRHMFPLTPVPPKTRCGWLICFYDKIAAIDDYCNPPTKQV